MAPAFSGSFPCLAKASLMLPSVLVAMAIGFGTDAMRAALPDPSGAKSATGKIIGLQLVARSAELVNRGVHASLGWWF